MLLRISKNLLRKGIYVESVECSDAEFSARRFLIDSDTVLNAILNSPASDVVVNTARSQGNLDFFAGIHPPAHRAHGPLCEQDAHSRMRSAISQSVHTLQTGFETIKSGGLDIGQLAPAAQVAAQSLEQSADVFMAVTRLRSKDKGTYVHCLAVSALMTRLGQALDLDDDTIRELGIAGLLHDVGKLLIPNEILNSKGPLGDTERQVIRKHPEWGYCLLKEHPHVSDIVLDVCRLHHEALDGSGYPLGLKAGELSLPVRICTVCETCSTR